MAESPVSYRPLCPSDYAALKLLHQRLFPLDYDDDFFARAVHGLDSIVSWAAAAPLPALTHVAVVCGDLAPQLLAPLAQAELLQLGPPLQQLEQQQQLLQQQAGRDRIEPPDILAGFITARAFEALHANPRDRQLLGVAGAACDQHRLLYVLTLGVAEPFQRQGIARRLLEFVLTYAAETACRAVYLHVAAFNHAARAFYERSGFRELAVLPDFYTIRTGRQPEPARERYDACLLGCIIQPPEPTPWGAANLALTPLTAVVSGINTCMTWAGCTGKRVRDVGDAADAASSASHTWVLELAEEGRELGNVTARTALGVAGQGQAPDASAVHQQPAPEWLRKLFARR